MMEQISKTIFYSINREGRLKAEIMHFAQNIPKEENVEITF